MPTPIDPESLAKRLALALITSHYRLGVTEAGRIALSRGDHAVVMLWGLDAVEQLPNLGKIGNADVLILGGPPDVRKRLTKARPMLTQGRVYLFHVDDSGDVWQSDFGNPGKLGPLLRRWDELPEADPETFEAQASVHEKQVRAEKAEVRSFQQRLDARKPVATYVVAGAIAAFFGLEHLWGGSDSIPTLVHMGALIRQQAFAEPWRLLSCSFLHAGFMHFAFNTYVLIALGRSLERILGHQRFLVLYVASALGGSVASTVLLGEGISVGASGAVWGLLAAEAVLAYRPAGLLPAAALPAIKRAALINLGLNIANSLRPDVDWAAHFGGGVVGGALLAAGLLTVGLPRLAAAPPDEVPKDSPPSWLRPTAVSLAVLLAAGGLLGILMGKPWMVGAPRAFTARALGPTGLHVEIPENLAEQESAEEDSVFTSIYGDLMLDSMIVEVSVFPFDPPLTDEELELEGESLESILTATIPANAEAIGEAEETREGKTSYRVAVHRLGNGLILESAAVVTPGFTGRASVVAWPQLRRDNDIGIAERAVRSISP